ncbi:hypothetical protein BDV12DRAFT_190165 [Aspergillus spectabilis]
MSWTNLDPNFNSFIYSSGLFVNDSLLDECLVISGDEYQVISHYQHAFILARLLKTPRWSTFACILHSVFHVPMAMHFLIAVSSMDLNQRSPHSAISLNLIRAHFQKGTELLVQQMNSEAEPHHVSTLSSWVFAYLCIAHRDVLDKNAVNRLSTAVLKYLQRYNLNSSDAAIPFGDRSLAFLEPDFSASVESGLIARVILLLATFDANMAFEGCGGHLASHLYTDREVYWRIFSRQRFILERYWGISYPEYELQHDLESAGAIEMGYKLQHIFHQLNELSEKSGREAILRDSSIERLISEIKMEYSAVLRTALSPTASQISFPRPAQAAVCFFYFVQIYYFRLTAPDSTQATPLHITLAMANTMNIVHQAFSQQEMGASELYQLPLFMVGIETRDQIHADWIQSRMSRLRFRSALSQIRSLQEKSGSRLSISDVREILCSCLVSRTIE